MAALSQQQVQERLQKPKNKREIDQAAYHDDRLRFHTEPQERVESYKDLSDAAEDFFIWVSSVIGSTEKLKRFKQFCTQPIYTTEITSSAFKELYKVFDTSNSYTNHEFESEDLKADFMAYLKQKKDQRFWTGEIFGKIKTSINAFIVVDIPSEQTSERPEPYWYTVDISQVIDVDITRLKNIDKTIPGSEHVFKTEYIIFKDAKGKIIALDDSFYRRYRKDDEKGYVLEVENPHELGYCPARQFYSEPYNSESKLRKKGPISTTLGLLDVILYNHVSENFADSFIPYPVLTKYREKCNYIESHTGIECVNGMVPMHQDQNPFDPDNPRYIPCPVCTKNKEVFPGTTIEVDPPETRDQVDQIDAVKWVQPSVEGLEYITKKNSDWEKRFMYRVVGKGEDFYNNQARNEKDIESRFESRETILRQIADNLETAMEWVYSTAAKIRYGDLYLSTKVFLGDKYFLQSISELNKVYKEQKENGYPEYQLSITRQKIIETKYKDDPEVLQKAMFLSFIEPLQGKTLDEIIRIRNESPGAISDRDYEIKINFDSFVRRFEMEVMPVSTLLDQVKRGKMTFERAIMEFNKALDTYSTKPKPNEED